MLTFNPDHCAECPLRDVGRPSAPVGNENARFMVVTDTPTAAMALRGRVMSQPATAVFASSMAEQGFAREDVLFVPQIRCPHNQDEYPTKVRRAIQQHCRAHLLDTVYDSRPECVVPLGAEATRQVTGRAVKITTVRGVLSYNEDLDAHVLPMVHPGQVVAYPQHRPIFDADIATLRRVVDAGYNTREAGQALLGRYEFVDDIEFLIEQDPPIVVVDTEDTGLRVFERGTFNVREYDPELHGKERPNAAILTIQLCITPGEAYMIVWDHPERPRSQRSKAKLVQQLRRLLCRRNTRVVGQNVKFDALWFWSKLGITFKIGGDTLMMAAIVDENMMSKSQDTLVKTYVPEMAGYADEFNATTDKSRMWEVPLSRLIEYGCGDADSCLRLYYALWDIISQDKKLVAHYRHVSLPGLNTFFGIEQRGLPVDDAALDAFEAQMAESVQAQYNDLIAQVPASIKRAHIDKGLAFSRGDFLRDILFNHRDGFRLKPKVYTKTTARLPAHLRIPSTSTKDHLPYFFDECPFTVQLAQYIKDERLLGTNIRGFRNKYIWDGLVRSIYALWVAVTGRTSSEDPNGQNFPKRGPNATAYRRVYVAPPGYVVLEADLSQAELRISADMANDRAMLRVYNAGGDIHSTTAAMTLNVSLDRFMEWGHDSRKLVECANEIPGSGDFLRKLNPGKRRDVTVKDYYKSKRQEAKAINFGFIYGMGWRKFVGYAKTQYGVEFTDEEAQAIREAYFRRYADLTPWHERTRAYARRHKQVRSYSGRIRHLPMIDSGDDMVRSEAERQAINSPVQEFGSSLGVMAMGRMHEEMDDRFIAPVAFVHDAIYCFVPEEYAIWGAQTLKWYMQSNPLEKWFGITMKCPIVADVSIGRNLGDTYEMEGLEVDVEYDYSSLWDEEKQKGIQLCEQRTPPNDGYRTAPFYSFVD